MTSGEIAEDRIYRLPPQCVNLSALECRGRILDIGGGGEGIIGRLFGDRVIAVDPNRQELEEAPEGPVKVVMDARELLFLDKSFDVITCFFTLMYIPPRDHRKVLEEARRVLKPGGSLLIWDVVIPPRLDHPQDIFVVPLCVQMGAGAVSTGFGTLWTDRLQNADSLLHLAGELGFTCGMSRVEGETFYLALTLS